MPRQENTYKKMLDTALNLLALNGYQGTSIKDITDQVGLTKAAFYAHFQNKSQLLGTLIGAYETGYIDQLIQRVDEQAGNAIEKLHRLISFSSGVGRQYRKSAILFYSLSEDLKTGEDIEPIRIRCSRKLKAFLVDLFDQGNSQGLVRKDIDSTMLAHLTRSFSRGLFKQALDNASHFDGMEYVRSFRKVFFQGIKAE